MYSTKYINHDYPQLQMALRSPNKMFDAWKYKKTCICAFASDKNCMQSKNMKAHVKFYRAGEMKNKLSGSDFRFW